MAHPKVFTRHVRAENQHIAEERFALRKDQFFGEYKFKNLWWVLNGVTIGYGDLRDDDIEMIQLALGPDEEFLGFNEHHGSQFQQTPHAMVKITHEEVTNPVWENRTLRR